MEFLTPEEQARVPEDRVLRMRYLNIDKNGTKRGDKSYDELPLWAKSRLIVPGFKDSDA